MRLTTPVLTLLLRSYGRPLRTRRMLECIQAQTMNNIELIFWGDDCRVFDEIVQSDWFTSWKAHWKNKGNQIFHMNNVIPGRDYGAKIVNQARFIARGHYICILDNDDKILPEYAKFQYESIVHSGCDFVYNSTWIYNCGMSWLREPEIKHGSIGHNELIIRTEFLRKMPPEEKGYDQDWKLIQNMVMAGGKHQKGNAPFPVYHVMCLPGQIEQGMENDN